MLPIDIMKIKEKFEETAEEIGMCLDCKFFEPFPNYVDEDTKLAFRLFKAGWESGSINKAREAESE